MTSEEAEQVNQRLAAEMMSGAVQGNAAVDEGSSLVERIGGRVDEEEWEDCNANKGDAKLQKEEAKGIEGEEEKVAGEVH